VAEEEQDLQKIIDEVEELIYHMDLMKVVDLLEENRKRFELAEKKIFVSYLLKMGWVNTRRRRIAEAFENCEEALGIIEQQDDGDPEWLRLKQEYMWGKGRLLRFSGKVDEALDILEDAIKLRQVEDLTGARPHLDMAPILSEKGRMSEALDHYREAVRILETTDKLNELARSYNNISDAYIKTSDYQTGLEYADKCIKLSGEIGNNRVAGFGAMNGGEALIRMGEPARAREYYHICKEAWEDTKNDYEMGSLVLLLGMIETREGNFEQAREAFEEADIFMEGQDRMFYSARVKHEYGILLIKMGEVELAKGKLMEAAVILEKYNWDKELAAVKEKLKEVEKDINPS